MLEVKKKKAIIVDMDGTLAKMGDRSPYDFSRVSVDTVNLMVWRVVVCLARMGYEVLIVSGRESSCEVDTTEWLINNRVPYFDLFMRETGDHRKDALVKMEIYKNFIEPKYEVELVLDDRNQVVEMWRSLGLTCFQVAEGNF